MAATTDGSVHARTAFFQRARQHTALLGVTSPSGVFVVDAADAESSLPTRRSAVEALASAMSTLDALGMGPACRQRSFVELGAVDAAASVAAVRRHGFQRALAIGAAPSTLRVNLILNDVDDLVEVLPDAPLDAALAARGVDPGDVGLLWIDAGADALVAGAGSVLRERRPVVGRAGITERLKEHYASFVDLGNGECVSTLLFY